MPCHLPTSPSCVAFGAQKFCFLSRTPARAQRPLPSQPLCEMHHLTFNYLSRLLPLTESFNCKEKINLVMPQPLVVEQSGSDADLKGFSCLTCRQRKVKCDRRTPCSNCVKAEKQCSFIPPVRGKRKRTKRPKEGLHAKLKRYEELLKSYDAQFGPSEYGNDTGSDSETVSQPDVEMAEDAQSRSRDRSDPYGLEETKPMLITKEGVSRYLDRYVVYLHLGCKYSKCL